MGLSRYATIVEGDVVNVSLWDGVSVWAPDEGDAVGIPDGVEVSLGWTYIDGEFVAPPTPELPEVE
jgi:hypothetical protein